jgi:hypothetical protein
MRPFFQQLARFFQIEPQQVSEELTYCHCFKIGPWYYADTTFGCTLDVNRAHRMQLEEACWIKSNNPYFKDFEIVAVPSLILT